MTALTASAEAAARAPRRAGPVIAIASGKGGVGKTALALALARAFALRKARTLLVDADLGMANVDVQLGLNPPGDLGAVVSGRLRLEEAVAPACGGSHRAGGFDVIAGPSGSGALAGLDIDAVGRLAGALAAASMGYDRTLIDLAAGAERATLRLAAAADDVLVVINDEPTSLTDAYAFVKTLRVRDEGASPFVVVNNAPGKAEALSAYAMFARTCESFLGFRPPLAGIIRRDPHVPGAIRAQAALDKRYPGTDAARDAGALAQALEQGVAPG
ncbi:MAG: AAA family ATPase [Oceanicaulis sp.]|nr:AAA family ATPase [Oceanicaulis sp.]